MSLKSVARYIANVGKSVGYATVQRIDEDNKSIKDILDFYTVKKVEPAKETIENKEK